MAYGDIPDLDFTVDENGDVTYGSGPKPVPKTTTTDKKWWETVIGVVPALVTAIFGGGNAQAQQPTYVNPTPQSAGLGSSNILIIGIVAIALIFAFSGKKSK